MLDYILNIRDAYRNPVDYKEAWGALRSIKNGFLSADNYSTEEIWERANLNTQQKMGFASASLKLAALLPIMRVAYQIISSATCRSFTYKGTLYGAVRIIVGHDLSKMGHNLSRKYVMNENDVKKEDRERNLGYRTGESRWVENKISSGLNKGINWCFPVADGEKQRDVTKKIQTLTKGTISCKSINAIADYMKWQ